MHYVNYKAHRKKLFVPTALMHAVCATPVTGRTVMRRCFKCFPSCDVIKALFEIRSTISGGRCLEPTTVAGASFDIGDELDVDYFVNKVSSDPQEFWCRCVRLVIWL